MTLKSVFGAVAVKVLTQVDLPRRGSHQHEINGVAALREFFKTYETKETRRISWHYFSDNIEPLSDNGTYTFYDAREKSADRTRRSEWRLYYYGEFLSNVEPGDTLILARTSDGSLFGLIFQQGSSWLRAAEILFPIADAGYRIHVVPESRLSGQQLDYVKRKILDELGITVHSPETPADDEIAYRELELARKAKLPFPTTRHLSGLARSLVDIDISDGDSSLVQWVDREERLFFAMERILVQKKIKDGFESVEDFISYSLSVQNRRKSRMGYAFQNHLEYLFTQRKLRFETQRKTEGKNKPDFLFPGHKQYHDSTYDQSLLVMLGAKSSLKDRWRQVLTEAARIPDKHVCTLEPAISVDQTEEMKIHGLTLVIPAQLHSTFTDSQRSELLTIDGFIAHVRHKQGGSQ